MLKPLVRKGAIKLWDDTSIRPGAKWRAQIQQALDSARAAVLLVSADFLASDFIAEHELPQLLKAAQEEGVTILWVYLSPCLYKETEISDFQAAHEVAVPLDQLDAPKQKAALLEICERIKKALGEG